MKLRLALAVSLLSLLAVSTAWADPPADTGVVDPWARGAQRRIKPKVRPKMPWANAAKQERRPAATVVDPWRRRTLKTRRPLAPRWRGPRPGGQATPVDPWRGQAQRPTPRGQVVDPWRRGSTLSPASRGRLPLRRPWFAAPSQSSTAARAPGPAARPNSSSQRPRRSLSRRGALPYRGQIRLRPPAATAPAQPRR